MSSQNSGKKCRLKDSASIFDNLKGYSQPVAPKVFGLESDRRSSPPVLRSTKKSSDSVVNLSSSDMSSSQRKRELTTIIENCSPKRTKNVEKESENLDSSDLNKDWIYAVILPLVLDKDFQPYSQPVLVKILESQLERFGFTLPFSDFTDKKETTSS